MDDKKQLPKRPTKDKPILKYSTTGGSRTASSPMGVPTTRPAGVPVFTPAELNIVRTSMYPGMSSTQASLYMASLMGLQHPSATSNNYLFVGGPSGASNVITPAHILTANTSPPKPSSTAVLSSGKNPYARPLSAKDIQPESNMMVKNTSLGLRNTSSGSNIGNVNNNKYDSMFAIPQSPGTLSNGIIQTNSFMRPRSAVQSEINKHDSYTSHNGAYISNGNSTFNGSTSSTKSAYTVSGTSIKSNYGSSHVNGTRPAYEGMQINGNSDYNDSAYSTVDSAYDSALSNGHFDINSSGYSTAMASTSSVVNYTITSSNASQSSSSTVTPTSTLLSKPPTPPTSPKKSAGSATNGHAVIHIHVDHQRPAERGIPKPPTNVKPQNARPPSGRISGKSPQSQKFNSSSNSLSGSAVSSSPQSRQSSALGDTAIRKHIAVSTSKAVVTQSSSLNKAKPSSPATLIINRPPPSPVPKSQVTPSSTSTSRSSSAASAQSVEVRNPHYTPSKPYSEHMVRSEAWMNPKSCFQGAVKEDIMLPPELLALLDSDEEVANGDLPDNVVTNIPRVEKSPSSTTPVPSAKDILTPPSTKPAFKNQQLCESELLRDGSVKRMPVTNTMTGTIYYRKQSKAEEMLHDLSKRERPKAEGAPAKPALEVPTSGWDRPATSVSERLPGDGEADVEEDNEDDDSDDDGDDDGDDDDEEEDDVDDDGLIDDDDDDNDDDELDNIEDDDECDSDDNSDGYSITSAVSRKSSGVRLKSATKRLLGLSINDKTRPRTGRSRPQSASTEDDLQPGLMPSLFPHVPPTVNFVLDGEKVEQLPWEIRKMLKWKMSPITPNVVKNCIARSNFRATKRNHDWIGYWGKHMKAPGFKSIREYQKVNHFPGSFQIGRKDRLWRNLSKMQVHFGKKEYGFFPQTFCLPFDLKQLKRAWEDGGSKQKWIIKPPASARGIGIKVIHKWNQIPKRRPVIVQRYIARPYLINESKFDIRLYVYVTSYDPLRIYLYEDGLARFASCKYSNSLKSLNNRYMHLTNYSINKKNSEYENNSDENICQGHKWGLKALWGYMKKQGINTSAIWENIKDLIIKTIISSEPYVNPLMKANARRRYCCHELFGFDVMLDDQLKPWIIEVNISPSLHSNSPLDVNIKGGMIKDLLNISGFQIPDKNDVKESQTTLNCDNSRYVPPNEICMDRRMFPTQLAPDERSKHAYYCQRAADEFIQQTIAEQLTPDDVRMLVETIDEDSRRGNMQRIFPSATSHRYLRFFEQPRYYNLLLDTWTQKYLRMEARGIAYVETLCVRGIHLEQGTEDPRHQWAPPNTNIPRSTISAATPDSRINSAPHKNSAPGPVSTLPNLRKKKSVTSKLGSHSEGPRLLSQPVPPPAH